MAWPSGWRLLAGGERSSAAENVPIVDFDPSSLELPLHRPSPLIAVAAAGAAGLLALGAAGGAGAAPRSEAGSRITAVVAVPSASTARPASSRASGPAAPARAALTGAQTTGSSARGTRPAPANSGPSAAATLSPSSSAGAARSSKVASSSSSVKVYGHGLGPGWGLGQWGSFGYASESGYRWSYQRIIGHFYSGDNRMEHISSGLAATPINVNLSELDGASSTTLKANRSGAHVTVNGAKRWGTRRITHDGGTITVVANAGDVRVDLPGVGWRAYKGKIVIRSDGETWNEVPLESYVAGVVPSESPAGWGASGGEAALQSQAIAARSYALNYVDHVGYICDTQSCQVYAGDPGTNPGVGRYAVYSDEAERTTGGVVVCRTSSSTCAEPDIVSTQFASSTGGYTSGSGFPAVIDGGDAVNANPWHDWTVYVPVSSVERVYPRVGTVKSLLVSKRNRLGAMGGRAVTVTIGGTRGSTSVDASTFEYQFGLYSNWFRVSTQP